jgi:hypothetical protein
LPAPSERAIGLAKKVLAKCMAYDPHFPHSSDSMIMAWAEHISLKNTAEEDMLDAVTAFYEHNIDGVKPLPATITTLAREIRRERGLRETVEEREAREARIDAKAEGHVVDLDRKAIGSRAEKITLEEWEARHGTKLPTVVFGKDMPDGPNPLKVRCPWCKAAISFPCTIPGTSQALSGFHDARLAKVQGNRCAGWAGLHVTPHSEDCEFA